MVMMALATGFCLDNTLAEDPPEGYWSLQQATEILDKTRGLHVEIILKDIHTLRGEPYRLWEWAQVAMELAQEC